MNAFATAPSIPGRDEQLRFAFGKNWAHFLQSLNEDRIQQAEQSLKRVLRVDDLQGQSFLDVGSGSGLFSLAARRLGARVHSFDYDTNSVGCAQALKQKFDRGDNQWSIEQGSALDEDYIRSLGKFDVVYSWGVLHHTGDMQRALRNVTIPVKPGGRLLISIYNDQGRVSERWTYLKRMYGRSSRPVRFSLALLTLAITWGRFIPVDIIRLKPLRTIRAWRAYSQQRGMSAWHDVVDWAGGYPFEVATPEMIFETYQRWGFRLEGLKTCGGGKGCNEFLFLNDQSFS